MIKIEDFTLPDETRAVVLEPRSLLNRAIIEYNEDKDVLIYDVNVLIECFQEGGMTEEEAWDWFHYNTVRTGDYVPNYPKFIFY